MTEPSRPVGTAAGTLPTPTPETNLESARFWEAAAAGRIELPKCENCQQVIWYPRLFCPHCGGQRVSWFEASGKGTIYSFTVVERGQGRWRDHSPYVLAYVELDEGPRMMTNIIEVDPDEVEIGQQVRVRFEPAPEGGAIIRFEAANPRSQT